MNMKKTVKIIKKGMMIKNKRFLIPFKINKIKNGWIKRLKKVNGQNN
jgi:hypothetical protein